MNAFILGFPRLLARGLASRLLALSPGTVVHMLVSPEQAEAFQAFSATLETTQRLRLHARIGRAFDTDLGLDAADANAMLADTTHVFHAGQLSQGPRAGLKRHNVDALGRLVELCLDMPRLERLVVFSTAFVSGSRTGLILEDELEEGQRFRSPWERSMFDAERLLRRMMPLLPVTVLRPGSMIGHSRTGEAETLDEGPSYLMRLLVRLPAEVPILLPGDGVVPLNIVPIDYVVRAACAVATKPEAVSRTLHITDPNPLSARRAFELLSDVARRRGPWTSEVGARLVRGLLRLPGLGALAPTQVSLFENLDQRVEYDCAGTLDLLADTGLVCPPFEAYADTLVAWIAAYERAQRPRERARA